MPFLHVRSLPPAAPFDVEAAVRATSAAFCAGAGVDERHVTVTWQLLAPGSYAAAGATAAAQPDASHPVLVELVASDANPPQRLEAMLLAAARAVAAQARVPDRNVFVELRPARSGLVYDEGEVVRW
jgi:hypothetical protein